MTEQPMLPQNGPDRDYQIYKDLYANNAEAINNELRRSGIVKLVAHHTTRKAIENLNNYDSYIKETYLMDSPVYNFTHELALTENEERNQKVRERNLDIALDEIADDLSDELAARKDEYNFESLDSFDKLDFIFNFAKELSRDKKVPYIKSDKNSVAINGSQVTYINYEYGNFEETVAIPIETKITKKGNDSFEIDFIDHARDYDEWKDRHSLRETGRKVVAALERGDSNEARRKGLAIAVKKVLGAENLMSTSNADEHDIEKPYKKILIKKDGSGYLLMPNPYLDLPEGAEVVSRKTGKKIERSIGDYTEDKKATKEAVERLVNSLSNDWIHGIIRLSS